MSPLAIALIAIGGVVVVGGGGCVALGALMFVGAKADADPSAVEPAVTAAESPEPPSAAGDPTSADPASAEGEPNGASPAPAQGADDAPSGAKGAAGGPAPKPAAAGQGVSWWCTASASVRVCGFAGACNYQMVFGNGSANDRFLAQQQAKHACEASARAKGATAVCMVQCSPRAR